VTGVRRLLRALDRLLDCDLALAVLPGLIGISAGLWGSLFPDAFVDHGLGWVTAAPSAWKPRELGFAVLSLILALLVGALARQWAHRHVVKVRGGVLLAVDELGLEENAKAAVLAGARTDYLEVIEVPGPRALDAGWHWIADEAHGPRWDAALDQLVFGVRTCQGAVAEGPMPALVIFGVDWPVSLGLGQRLGGGYSGRNRPQRIVPRSSNGRGRPQDSDPSLDRPQIIKRAEGYSLTERLGRSEYRWPVDLGPGSAIGEVPTLLLVRATGQVWGQLPCQGEAATQQRRQLDLRDVTGLGLTLTGDQEVYEARWHLPDAPDRMNVEPRDTVNLAQDIARWVDNQVRRAPGDVLLGMLAPPAVVFAVGVLWAQELRDRPLTGRRVLPVVYDRACGDLAVVGLDLARTAPRAVLESPGIGDGDHSSRPTTAGVQP
jgi:hypothetical protein